MRLGLDIMEGSDIRCINLLECTVRITNMVQAFGKSYLRSKSGMRRTFLPSFFACSCIFFRTGESFQSGWGSRLPVAQ